MPTTFVNSKPEISCIYVNYRSAQFLQDSLESLFVHEAPMSFEVIVVNNDERERAALKTLQEKYPFRIFEALHNPGFGASANAGAQEARGEVLFFVNPDTRWQEPFLEEAVHVLKTTPKLGALGIQLISPLGRADTRNMGNVFTLSSLLVKSQRQKTVDWVSGGALFARKNIFQSVGGFDEQFFMYFEDRDLCLRLHKEGYRTELLPKRQLVHLGGKSHPTKRKQKKIYDQSLYRYTKKHWPAWQHTLFRFLHPCYRFFFPYGRS